MALVPDHEDDVDQQPDDQLKFTKTPGAGVTAPVPAPRPEGKPTVGVREPRRPAPRALQAAAAKPVPVAERPLPDVVGTPFPGVPEPIPAAMRPIFDTMMGAIEQIPKTWTPKNEQLGEIHRRLGQQTEGRTNTVMAMAEDATADAWSRIVPGMETLPITLIPLIKWIFRKRTPQIRAGVLGRAGPQDPASRYNPIKGSQGTGKSTYAPRVGGGFAMQTNMSQWMRELQGQPVRRQAGIE